MARTKILPQQTSNAYRFRVRRATDQSLTGTEVTTVQFATETFDTNNNYNTGTYKYVVPVSGYYLFSAHARVDLVAATYIQLHIAGEKVDDRLGSAGQQINLKGVVFNYYTAGTEIVVGVYHNGTATVVGSSTENAFSGFLHSL